MEIALQGVTAASSGTHTRWWEEQASNLALLLARPYAGCGGYRYRRGAAEIPGYRRGLRDP